MDDPLAIPILLLGDPGVGKSTFLSRLVVGHTSSKALPRLHDLDQPFSFNIKRQDTSFRLQFSDTASPTNYTLLKPAVIILCYSIATPGSLTSLHSYWKKVVETYYNYNESIPVVVLGLQRDVRNKEDYDGHVRDRLSASSSEEDQILNPRTFTYPQEGLRIAQEMRCDRYCECSALTGELCREVFDDIAKTAALTTSAIEQGERNFGTSCCIS